MNTFKENEVICFFGDSITHVGSWIRRVYQYHLETASIKCKIYNCGVSGLDAGKALMIAEDTVYSKNPDKIIISFGMNDVTVPLYDGRDADGSTILERRFKTDQCVDNIRKIADLAIARGKEIILCTPTPYDELSDCEGPCAEGVNAALREVAERVRLLAKGYNCTLVDFHSEFFRILKKLYKTNQKLLIEDRTHPKLQGYELMAQIFLRAQGFDVPLSGTYEQLDSLSLRGYSEWEQERFRLEAMAKAADFVEFCLFTGIKDTNYIKTNVEKNMKTEKSEYILNCYNDYLYKYDEIQECKKQLDSHTKR